MKLRTDDIHSLLRPRMRRNNHRKVVALRYSVEHIHQFAKIRIGIDVLLSMRAHHKELPFHHLQAGQYV